MTIKQVFSIADVSIEWLKKTLIAANLGGFTEFSVLEIENELLKREKTFERKAVKPAKHTIVKLSRAQYQVIDINGNNVFTYPTSRHEAQGYINDYKVDEKFLNDPRMQRVAMDYINEQKLPVSAYGDLSQFMANSIYNMFHRDIREIQRRKELYREHLYKVAAKNKQAREESLKNL